MAITIDSMAASLNQYCDKFSPTIHTELRQSLEFEATLPSVSCEYAYTAEDVTSGDILQPYQADFTPNNNTNDTAETNILQLGKGDVQYTAKELQQYFNKYHCNRFQLGIEPNEWAFPQYLISMVVIPKIMEEINIASYKGVRKEPVDGEPGAFLDSWDGYAKKIADAITAGKLVPIITGAFVDNTMVVQLEDACAQLPLLYRERAGVIYMSPTLARKYAANYRDRFPQGSPTVNNPSEKYMVVDHYNKRIVACKCMEGSNRIIFNFDNLSGLMWGFREGEPQYPNFRFQVYERKLKALSEISRFYGVETWRHTFVNDQE